MPRHNNYAFIDGQNFFKSKQELELELEALEVELDLSEFRRHLREKHKVGIAYYFLGYIPWYTGMYSSLQGQGYTLKFKEVARQAGELKGNVDVNLTMQTFIDSGNYDKAVIVASDGDYADLAKYLHSQGKLECLICCSRGGSSRLLRKLHTITRIYYLDDIMRDLYKRKETS